MTYRFQGVQDFLQDVRYTVRSLSRAPSFAVAAVLTIGLGTGVNSAMFSALYGSFFAPLPYREPNRLVEIRVKPTPWSEMEQGTSAPNLLDWMSQNRSFDALGGHRSQSFVSFTGCDVAEELRSWRVSAQSLAVLAVPPETGRWFVPDEDRSSGDRSAIISDQLWTRCFSRAANIIGKKVHIDGEPFTVVGVMPPEFEFPPLISNGKPSLWLSLNLTPEQTANRENNSIDVIGRLKPGVSIRQAQVEMDGIVARLTRAFPRSDGQAAVANVRALGDPPYARGVRSTLVGLSLAGALVLLIACVNVANLVIARDTNRSREFSIRVSLGISQSRLVRQVITESCVLSVIGSCVGAVLAHLSIPLLKTVLTAAPRIDQVAIRSAVLVFSSSTALVVGVLLGIVPALRALRPPAPQSPGTQQKVRKVLVAFQVAACFLLLCAAGGTFRVLWTIYHTNLGFRPDHVLSLRINLSRQRYGSAAKVEAYRQELLRLTETLPGIEAAGTNSAPPMGILTQNTDFEVDGGGTVDGVDQTASFANVSANYLTAMGTPIIRGRDFNSSDRAGSPAVAIVSKSLARRYFTAEDALGKRLLLRRLGWAERFTIIGVAQDLRQTLPKGTPERTVYTLSTQLPESEQGSASSRIIGLIIRTRVDPSSIAPTIRRVVAGIDKDQAVADMVPMEVAIDRRMAGLRDNTMLVALFAALAVTLAVVGVFSVVSYSVLSRRREFGIRTALGAQRASILALIIFETMPYGIVGVAVGMASVLGASRFLSSLFYNVDISTGPLILTVSGFLITVVMMSIVVAARGTMVMKVGEALRQP